MSKKIEVETVIVEITKCKDKEGRFFHVGVKHAGAKCFRNAVLTSVYSRAVEYATEFLKDEEGVVNA